MSAQGASEERPGAIVDDRLHLLATVQTGPAGMARAARDLAGAERTDMAHPLDGPQAMTGAAARYSGPSGAVQLRVVSWNDQGRGARPGPEPLWTQGRAPGWRKTLSNVIDRIRTTMQRAPVPASGDRAEGDGTDRLVTRDEMIRLFAPELSKTGRHKRRASRWEDDPPMRKGPQHRGTARRYRRPVGGWQGC